jgi:hypothetical protein
MIKVARAAGDNLKNQKVDLLTFGKLVQPHPAMQEPAGGGHQENSCSLHVHFP